jgi:hypothetical protein
MSYIRGKSSDYLARLQHQKQIAAAELEHEERRLQQIRDAEMELARIEHKRRVVRDQIKDATTPSKRRLPPPIHGGKKGLEEAARESYEYDKRRRPTKA